MSRRTYPAPKHLCDSVNPLDNDRRSEASSRSGAIRVVGTSVRLVEGDASDAAARAQGEALMAIARSLGLVDDKGGD